MFVPFLCRVLRLHERWVEVMTRFQNGLLRPLTQRITNYPVKETQVVRSTKTVIEMRPVETDENFRLLEENILWVSERLVRAKQKSKTLKNHLNLLLHKVQTSSTIKIYYLPVIVSYFLLS